MSYRLIVLGIGICIIELILQIIGWINFEKEYIIKSPFCSYYMNGISICPLFFNGFNNKRRTYKYCFQFEDDCQSANTIRDFYIAILSLPLFSIIFLLISLVLYFLKHQNKLFIQCLIKIIQMVISIFSIILIICEIIFTSRLASDARNLVNLWIRDWIWIIFGIRILYFILFAFFYWSLGKVDQAQQPLEQQPGYDQRPGQHIGQQPSQQQSGQGINQNRVHPENQIDAYFTQPNYNPVDEDHSIR